MSKKMVALMLAVLMLFCMAPAMAAESAVAVTDMFGREIVLDEPVSRIVALTPADCEILCAIGCEDMLVGRGEYCNYPESVLELPVLSTGDNLNLEEILALEPQVVLMNDMNQSKEQVAKMEENGVKVVVSRATDIEGVYAAIRMIGALTTKDAEAEALVADMQAAFADIAANCENTGKTVFFEVSPLEYGLWTAGSNTFMDELATMCGLTNAFADVDGWGAVSEEQVISRDPDYIVTITMYFGEGPTPVEEILGRNGWGDMKAVANSAVLNADSDAISRPGPRLKDAALEMYAFLKGLAEEVPAA